LPIHMRRRNGLDHRHAFCDTPASMSAKDRQLGARLMEYCSLSRSLSTPMALSETPRAAIDDATCASLARRGLGGIVLTCTLGLVLTAGCAAEPKKPETVTEWMKQRRVGEELRP
jgi:hypothetical protein